MVLFLWTAVLRPLIAWFRGEPPKKVKEGKAEGEAERPAEKEKLSSLEPASEVRHVMWLFLGLHPSIIAS